MEEIYKLMGEHRKGRESGSVRVQKFRINSSFGGGGGLKEPRFGVGTMNMTKKFDQ